MSTKSTQARDRATLWRRRSKKGAGFSADRAHTGPCGGKSSIEIDVGKSIVNTLGALTVNQAVQQVQAGLKAIYLSIWQVAGD